MNIELWSTTDGSNNATPPDGFPEGMARSTYNNSARAMMGAIRRWFDDPEWQNFNGSHVVSRQGVASVRIAGVDLTAYYTVGRRIRITGAGDNQGSVSTSTFAAGNTDLVLLLDSGATVPVGTNAIFLNAIRSLRTGGTTNTGTSPGTIPVNSGSGPLGAAAYKDVGLIGGQIPLNSNLGTLAYLSGLTRVYARKQGGDQTFAAGSGETSITELVNVAVPGTPNGSKKYRISCFVEIEWNGAIGANNVDLRIRMGHTGNPLTDAQVLIRTYDPDHSPLGSSGTGKSRTDLIVTRFEVQPASTDVVSITINKVGSFSATIYGGTTAGRYSWIEIEEIAA